MPQEKNRHKPAMSAAQTASDDQNMASMSVEGSEPELQALASESDSRNVDSARTNDHFVSGNKVELKDYFVTKEWHRPYVEALLETDRPRLGALIAEAEQAIFGRLLELLASPVPTDEILDLQGATYAIAQLKKATVVVYTPQHLVA